MMQRVLADVSATEAFAQLLAHSLVQCWPAQGQGISIALQGDLGAGKTTLVRALLRELGITGRIKSPSYAIAETYEGAHWPIWHFDFYRLSSAEEWADAGFRDVFASNALRLVEWPENLPAGSIPYDVHAHLQTLDDEQRLLQLQAGSATGQILLDNLCI